MPTYLVYILISSLVPIVAILFIWAIYFLRIACARKLRPSKRKNILDQHEGYTLLVTCKYDHLAFDPSPRNTYYGTTPHHTTVS